MTISLIAAIDEKNGLGKQNQLLCHLPDDLKFFKQKTLNKTVVMGYNTFVSIGRPLPNRQNIVLTRQSRSPVQGILFVHDIDEAISKAESDDIMIIGGAMLYRQTISQASKLYITRIHHQFEADVFFPTIDDHRWRCVSREPHTKDLKHDYDYTFLAYEKIDPRRAAA